MAVQQLYDGAGRVIRQRDLRNVTTVQSCSGTLDKEAVWRYGHDANQRQNFGALLSESDPFVERLFSYDVLGRQVSMRTRFLTRGSTSFLQSSTYDEFGRVYQRFDGGPNQSGLRYVYNERGYQVALREADDPSVVYQQIIQRDAYGNIREERLGNGLTTTRVYDRRGYLRQLQTLGVGLRVQDLQMVYDPAGNLMERHDYKSASSAGYQHEVIRYDALNRLQWVDLQLGNAAPVRTMSMSYDAGGRILSKEGISYGYDTALPVHAVKSRAGQSYLYDLNGNQTQRDGSGEHRTLTYTHFDKPARAWMGDHREESRYTYSPQRGRLERESWRSGVLQERYWFLGNLDVVVTNPSATNPSEIRYEYRRQIDGIAQVQIENGSETLKYFHYDHLGSVTAMSDTSPNLNNTQFSDYDAFGRRRHAQLWNLPITTNILDNATEYGFGGHESRDELGLVHMNGRSHDPDVGQMMQADAVVQSPMDGQNYNRYAYVFNNPLSYTDPTGYFASIPDLFFSTFFRYESNFGPVTGNTSDMQKAEKNMNKKGEPAANNPGVSSMSVEGQGNTTILGQDSFTNYLVSKDQAMLAMFSGENLVTRYVDVKDSTGFASNKPLPGYFNIPILGGIIQDFGNTVGLVSSAFRSDGEKLNIFTNETLTANDISSAKMNILAMSLPTGSVVGALGRQSATETTTLFRAVSQAELDDILVNGVRNAPGFYETGKLFATTIEDAVKFGRNNFKFDGIPNYLIKADVPETVMQSSTKFRADFMDAVSIPAEKLNQLNITPLNYSPLVK